MSHLPPSSRILITSGPTREYLDPVRFLTNASSGRMGVALTEAVLEYGDVPVVVSGPISRSYPKNAEVHWVETTAQMLQCCETLFPTCEGVIGAAAPCDFKPMVFSEQKLTKSDTSIEFLLRLESTPDILAALGRKKRPNQWILGFALETKNDRERALEKLRRKNCDFIALNGPESIDHEDATLEVFDDRGRLVVILAGKKRQLATELLTLMKEKYETAKPSGKLARG